MLLQGFVDYGRIWNKKIGLCRMMAHSIRKKYLVTSNFNLLAEKFSGATLYYRDYNNHDY